MIKFTSINNTNNIVEKAWGQEVIIGNNEEYCGKILKFKKNAKFSMHFHIKKAESWYVSKGFFTLKIIDTETAREYEHKLIVGDIITIERGDPHQLTAHEESEIFEVSTPHYDSDSYRISAGDSQHNIKL